MKNCMICTPVHRVVDYDATELRGVRPNETTWINMDHVAYVIAEEWIVKHPGKADQTWDIAHIVMADGTHFNVLMSDWKEWIRT